MLSGGVDTAVDTTKPPLSRTDVLVRGDRQGEVLGRTQSRARGVEFLFYSVASLRGEM